MVESNLDYPVFSIIQTFALVPILSRDYLLVMIKICSNILFKTIALKSAVRSEFVLLLRAKAAHAHVVTNEKHSHEF